MSSEYQRLANLVAVKEDNENSCRDALLPFSPLFLQGQYNCTLVEHITSEGRSDWLLVGEPTELQIPGVRSISFRRIIVFELKSPAKPVFNFDLKSKRYYPSKDLVLAETQLFAYTKTMRHNMSYYQSRYNASEISPGGIILGCDDTMFRIKDKHLSVFKNEDDHNHQKRMALICRNQFLYGPSGITLFTWSNILEIIKESL